MSNTFFKFENQKIRVSRKANIASFLHKMGNKSRELLLWSFHRCLRKLSSHRAGHWVGERRPREGPRSHGPLSEAWKTGHVPQSAKLGKHKVGKNVSGVSGEGDAGCAERLRVVLWRTWCLSPVLKDLDMRE